MRTVSATKRKSFASIVLGTLGWPMFWGLAATFAFYLLLHAGAIPSPMALRYFAGHPVEYIETALFFVGLAALLTKMADVAYQFKTNGTVVLPPPAVGGDSPKRAVELMSWIDELPSAARATYLARRLSDVLEYVRRSESADQVDEQLKYLADVDAERSHEGYGLVRMIVWATPMLGFLGTVIGITLALGDLSPEALVNAPKEAMEGLLSGLSIAFDTTALALSLSILLMFLQFLIRQVESQLLITVDRRATQELIGRFQQLGTGNDPHLGSIQKMSGKVLESVEELVDRQADIWKSSLVATQRQWADALKATKATVEDDLRGTLGNSMAAHAEALVKSEQMANERATRHWERMQKALTDNVQVLSAQRGEMAKQGEVMLRVLQATGDIVKLEQVLNQNLSALAGAKNFEDTVMSLAAAIHLLNSRLGIAGPRAAATKRRTGSERECGMRSRRQLSGSDAEMNLFPFLAVLICTMGSLIVLLVVVVQQARAGAQDVTPPKSEVQAKVAENSAEIVQRLQEQKEHYEWQSSLLAESYQKTTQQLADKRLELSHLEDHYRELLEQLKDMQAEALAIQQAGKDRQNDVSGVQAEISELTAKIALAKEELEDAKQRLASRPRTYALVPYDGPNGTRRRPIYIECLPDRVVLRPENIELTGEDFREPLDADNPLASALRAKREFLMQRGLVSADNEPYPLLIVRSGGASAYAAARVAMKAWEAEFGYELVEDDLELEFPAADSQLAGALEQVVEESRQMRRRVRALVAGQSPRQSGPYLTVSRSGGFERAQGGSAQTRGFASAGNKRFENESSDRAGEGPRSGRYTSGGQGTPENGGVPGVAERNGAGLSGREQYGNQTVAGRDGGQSFSDQRGGTRSSRSSNDMGTNGSLQNERPISTGLQDSAGGDTNPASSPRGQLAGQTGRSAPGQRGPNQAGQATGGDSQPGASGQPFNPFESLAQSRGDNWALPNATTDAFGITRPIRIVCDSQRLLVVPERDTGEQIQVFRHNGRVPEVIDDFVEAIRRRLRSWGIAGQGVYWKPLLQVEVMDGTEDNYEDLVALLEDSGLEVTREP